MTNFAIQLTHKNGPPKHSPIRIHTPGIKVLGRIYPLLKMQSVQGGSLTAFVGSSIGW